jgi:hypothetical protein
MKMSSMALMMVSNCHTIVLLSLMISYLSIGVEPVGYSSTYYRNISDLFHQYLVADG